MIPYFPLYLWKKLDIGYRLDLAERIRQLGFRRIGVQFLFIYQSETRYLDKLVKRAEMFKEHIEMIFDKVYYSVHAPFMPYSACSVEFNRKATASIARILSRFHGVEFVNVHMSHPGIKDWNRSRIDYKKKQKNLSSIATRLKTLNHFNSRICIENTCGTTPSDDHVTYIGNLPSDFAYIFSKVPEMRLTLDVCHSGLVSKACASMSEKHAVRSFTGFFEEEFKEIQAVAKSKDYAFLSLSDNLFHVHLSDFKGLRHGAVPGRGDRKMSYLMGFIREIIKAKKGNISVLAEIDETDYAKSLNTFSCFKILKGL
jgi:hypothetical protein